MVKLIFSSSHFLNNCELRRSLLVGTNLLLSNNNNSSTFIQNCKVFCKILVASSFSTIHLQNQQKLIKINSKASSIKSKTVMNNTNIINLEESSSTTPIKPSLVNLTGLETINAARIGGDVLRNGGIIATPTDTVYGIAADAQNIQAVQRIYEIKGRNPEKPIAICLSQVHQLQTWAKITVSNELLHDFLPGPVTLVFERQLSLNPELNPETNLIGIRIPNHKFIRQLAEEFGGPVALTSANRSSEPSTLSPNEFRSLWPNLDCIFDGGHILKSSPSLCTTKEATTVEEEEEEDGRDLFGNIDKGNPKVVDEKIVRAGSTVINLSQVGYYSIIREGSAYKNSVQLLKNKYKLIERH